MKLASLSLILLTTLWTQQATAQPGDISSGHYAALAGLYAFEDGRLAEIFDLVDQLGTHQLNVVEPSSGRVRTIYPITTTTFEAGPAWFVREPASYRLQFERNADSTIAGLQWKEEGETMHARRVRFNEQEVTFRNGEVTLAGTLVLPSQGGGPFPGMVMVHGSGPLTRRTQRYVADLFAHRGIAVLVYDKRGTGGSTGQWNALAHADWADDVRAALALLRDRPEIDASRVGLFAASEGGYVAPLVATTDTSLAFLICRVCAGIPHGPVILDMEAGNLRRRGYSEEEVTAAITYLKQQISFALNREDWAQLETLYKQFEGARWMEEYNIALHEPEASYWDRYAGVLEVDPQPLYAQLHLPILVLLGERDNRILVEKSQPAFESARTASGNTDFDIWVLPNASHGLMVLPESTDGQSGAFDRFVPDFHNSMVSWAVERVF